MNEEAREDENATKQFIVVYDDTKGYVDVSSKHTLADARKLIMEYADEDVVPSTEWAFCIDGIRRGPRQEVTTKAWAVIHTTICLVPRKRPNSNSNSNSNEPAEATSKLDAPEIPDNNNNKRLKRAQLKEAPPPPAPAVPYALQRFDSNVVSEDASACAPAGPGREEMMIVAPAGTAEDDKKMPATPERCSSARFVTHKTTPNQEDRPRSRRQLSPLVPTSVPVRDTTGSSFQREEMFDDDHSLGDQSASASVAMLEHEENSEAVVPFENPHQKIDQALETSSKTLKELKALLQMQHNADFCTQTRRQQWLDEIDDTLNNKSEPPKTVIGVLGSAGV